MPLAPPPRPPTGRRIAEARERLGLAPADLAARLDINLLSYWDLEMHDDEAFLVLSLRQLSILADTLHVSARALVTDDAEAVVVEPVTPADLASAIRRRLVITGCNVESLSEELGWDIAAILETPSRLWDDWCVDGLRDVCTGLGLDWRAILPDR